MANKIHTAPPNTGTAVLGRTLPELMYEACARFDNPSALNQPVGEGWQAFSLDTFRQQSEETALGLRDLGLERGNKVALYMHSDVYFCIADMGCLIAGLVDVPVYLSHGDEAVQYVLAHSESQVLFVSDEDCLKQVASVLEQTPDVRYVIVAQPGDEPVALPDSATRLTLDEVRKRGRAVLRNEPDAVEKLRALIDAQDIATLIYTSGTTGQPKGVMLTHENISYDALTSFSGLGDTFKRGPDGETAISFLPLTHIFARALHYGFVAYSTSVYFTTPDELASDMKKVRPTVFASVPRVLEKVYASILEKATTMTGLRKLLLEWALSLARRYELGQEPSGLYGLQLYLANLLVFSKWREALGGRIKYLIVGGAALNPTLANVFAAANITPLQGYGLTETSPVIAFNRPNRNRAGTVGEPLPGVEVRIAEDGEILTRGPHVMKGYFKNQEKTEEVIDADGWFHTGDIGEFSADGFLRITDRKKDLFKLSTGKYVMPQPLENRLSAHPLIEQAVVIGSDRKFCGALIFPNQESLRTFAAGRGINTDRPIEEIIKEPQVIARYQELVDEANEGMDHWATIKHFVIVPEHLTVENSMLTPTMKVKRREVRKQFEQEIETLYEEAERAQGAKQKVVA